MVSNNDYNKYLSSRAASLIRENFQDRDITNLLVVKWGKRWRNTLGHIKPLENTEFGSLIEINSLMKSTEIPEFVLDSVLMHELVHYFQGFGSNHERKSKHPHKGGVVDKELARLGWTEITGKSDAWIKANWHAMVTREMGPKKRRARSIKQFRLLRPWWMR
jgi:hypothetical protein